MKLHYRGAEYDVAVDNAIETVDGAQICQYRGAKFHVHVPKHPTARRAVKGMKYRGVPLA
jgi:hypothetical protein